MPPDLFAAMRKRWRRVAAGALCLTVAAVLSPLFLHDAVPMPAGTMVAGTPVTVADDGLRLLIDDTAWDPVEGKRVIRQEIFDEILAMIARADRFIYLDLFLWNPWQGSIPENHRRLSEELAGALISRKRSEREIDILVFSDPINRIYGGHEPDFFKEMAKAGIPVVFTDLDMLPDSNLLYAPYWGLGEKVLTSSLLASWSRTQRFANPFLEGGRPISALQLGRLLLFKANHRKVVITGSSRRGLEMLVGSLNPADGSSAHSNAALQVRGAPVVGALQAEMESLRWSIRKRRNIIVGAADMAAYKADSILRKARDLAGSLPNRDGGADVQWLTEGAIRDSLVHLLDGSGRGDTLRVALFYLGDREVVGALKGAVTRGASVRLVLDANRDAFGMKKIGVPNRPVAAELMALSGRHDVRVRWADTHGEQFHTKTMSIMKGDGEGSVLITGSANWTRRNIGNLNLEADLLVRNGSLVTEAFNTYFDRIWENSDGLRHTLPYEVWEEKGLKLWMKTGIYRFQERFGMGTF